MNKNFYALLLIFACLGADVMTSPKRRGGKRYAGALGKRLVAQIVPEDVRALGPCLLTLSGKIVHSGDPLFNSLPASIKGSKELLRVPSLVSWALIFYDPRVYEGIFFSNEGKFATILKAVDEKMAEQRAFLDVTIKELCRLKREPLSKNFAESLITEFYGILALLKNFLEDYEGFASMFDYEIEAFKAVAFNHSGNVAKRERVINFFARVLAFTQFEQDLSAGRDERNVWADRIFFAVRQLEKKRIKLALVVRSLKEKEAAEAGEDFFDESGALNAEEAALAARWAGAGSAGGGGAGVAPH